MVRRRTLAPNPMRGCLANKESPFSFEALVRSPLKCETFKSRLALLLWLKSVA
jgi:hypothetical protein